MSDSPGPGGDAENVDVKTSRARPAQEDAGIEAVPLKTRKVEDEFDEEEDEGADDEVADALEEEEQDFEDDEEEAPIEDVDFGDEDDVEDDYEGPSEENALEETGESSEVDDFIQTHLTGIDECQSEIESLNKEANNEILKVEQKYNKLRQPVYARRNTYIDKVPNFWATVFSRHSQLKKVLTKDDMKCLSFMTSLQIDDFEDSRSGYKIKFSFAKNDWFSNPSVTKEYHLPWNDSPSCECTPINWKPGRNLTNKPSSFFSWFCSQDDASTDDIAEIIKEELWPNPLQSYFMKENGEIESDGESEEEDEGPVYVDDDDEEDVEYISSEEEEAEYWRRAPALGKEAPGTSKQYRDEAGDEEAAAYEDDDLEDDDAADIESRGNYGFEEGDLSSDRPPEDEEEVGPRQIKKKCPDDGAQDEEDDDGADIESQGNYGYDEDKELLLEGGEDEAAPLTNNPSDQAPDDAQLSSETSITQNTRTGANTLTDNLTTVSEAGDNQT